MWKHGGNGLLMKEETYIYDIVTSRSCDIGRLHLLHIDALDGWWI